MSTFRLSSGNDVKIRNGSLDFKNIANIPDFWYNLIEYKEILDYYGFDVVFYINDMSCVIYKNGWYIAEIFDHIDCKKLIHHICMYNFKRGSADCDDHIVGYTYEEFYINGIPYRKSITIKLNCLIGKSYEIVEKIVKENPGYNFAKFNDNSDIKIALKD